MATFKKESSRSKLSKKLLSIALAASMMCGTGALAGTVATVSNLPVSAVSATLADTNGTLQSLAVGATFTASGVTYKILNANVSETMCPTVAIVAVSQDKFAKSTSWKLGTDALTLTYKDAEGNKATTPVKVTQIGDGSKSIVNGWSSDYTGKVKTVQIGSSVTTIASYAFTGVYQEYNASSGSATKPKLIIGNTGDHYGVNFQSIQQYNGLPASDFVVETESLNVVADSIGGTGYLSSYFNPAWTFRAYWGSYIWSVYTNNYGITNFENLKTMSLTQGVKDNTTGALYAYYLAVPDTTGSGNTSGSVYVTGAHVPSAISSGGEWRMFAYNAGCNVLGQTEANYGSSAKIFKQTGYSGTTSGSGKGKGLCDVLDLTVDMYNASVKFTPKVGVNVFSGSTEWKMKKIDNSGNLVANTINISNTNSNVFEVLTKKSLYGYTYTGTTGTMDAELATRINSTNGAGLGYKLSGDYGSGFLLLAGPSYKMTSSSYYYYPSTATTAKYNQSRISQTSTYYFRPYYYWDNYYVSSTSVSDTADTASVTVKFGSHYSTGTGSGTSSSPWTPSVYNATATDCSYYGTQSSNISTAISLNLPLAGSYTYTVAKEKLSSSGISTAYADTASTKIVNGYCDIKLAGLTPGYTYQLLYTSMKTSSFDKNTVSSFESTWLNKWSYVKTGGFNSSGKYTVPTNGATTLTINQAFSTKANTGYMICLKTYDTRGNEVRKSYGVVNSGDYRSYIASTDPTTNKRSKVYSPTTVLKVVTTESAAANGSGFSTSKPTVVVGMMVENGTGTALISNMQSTLYGVNSDGVVKSFGAMTYTLADTATSAGKYSLFNTANTKYALYAMSQKTLATDTLQLLGTGKITLYITKPTCNSTTISLLGNNKDTITISGTATEVWKVATINVSELGFKLGKSVERAGTGVSMSISKNNLTTEKYVLQEKVSGSWTDVSSMPTTTLGVELTSNGFTNLTASILPKVGTHTYRVKAITNVNGSVVNTYSNEQTVKITAGFINYPTVQLGANNAYNGSAIQTKTDANGTAQYAYVEEKQIKSIRMTSATDGVDIKLAGLATGDVYGLGTNQSVTTTFKICNGTGLIAVDGATWGVDMLGDVVSITPSNTLATTAIVQANGSTAIGSASDKWYPLNSTAFKIKQTGSYMIEATTTFRDNSSSGSTVTNKRYYYFKVTG